MSRRPAFFWCVIALGTALVLCYAAAGVELWRHMPVNKNYGYGVESPDGFLRVSFVARAGAADGRLRVGDRILSIDGHSGPPWLLARLTMLVPPGGVHRVAVLRSGTRLDLDVPVAKVPVRGLLYWGIPLQFIASLACFAVAMLMGLTKPGDRTVQFGCFSFLALAAMHLLRSLNVLYWVLDGWGRVMYALLALADPLPAATGYLFAARFPQKVAARPWWTVAGVLVCAAVGFEWVRHLPGCFLTALNAAWSVSSAGWLEGPLLAAERLPRTIWKAENVLIFAAIAAVLIRNYRGLQQPDQRRRIRWVMLGIVAALVPEGLLYAGATAYSLTGHGFRMDTLWFVRGEEISGAFIGVVLSLTVGYGVLQHRMLDIHVAVRRSIQYLLAKRVLQAAIALPVVLLVARGVYNPRLSVGDLLFGSYSYLALMAAATLGLVFRRRLLEGLDRRFFREAYSQEQILRSLIEEIKERDSITEISRLVSEKLETALHPQRVLVFYRRENRGDFSLGHSSENVEPELRVDSGCRVLQVLEESPGPRDFPFSDAGGRLSGGDEYFEKLGVCLMAPITGSDRRLVGILMLGEKRSESPYTGTDRDLLQAMAGQIGVVYENIALRESARREAHIKRNVLARLDGTEINLLKECPRCGTCFDRAVEQCTVDGAALNLTLPVERIVDGIYRLDRRVGTGAMGAVYRATDLRLGRPVAVKLMVGSLFGNQAALRRFDREARAAARLSHPNIVAIHDFGSVGSDGAYLVMEMIEGMTLRAELRAGPLEPKVAAVRFHDLMEGLGAAHAAGVVHRDLKPENLIVAKLGGGGELLKILDFGLAKVMTAQGTDTASLTMAGAVVGTMGYMSPEQLLGEEVDERTDTFSTGVLAIESLTGRRPFAGLSFQELLHATLHNLYRLPGEGSEVRRLNAVLERCLAKDRVDRPRVAEIRHELVEVIRGYPGMAGAATAGMEESTIDGTRPIA